MKHTPLLITAISLVIAASAQATLYSYEFSGKVTPTQNDNFYDDHHPGKFQGNVSWDSDTLFPDYRPTGSLSISTSGLTFVTDSLIYGYNDEIERLFQIGRIESGGEWTYPVNFTPDWLTGYVVFDRDTAFENARAILFGGVRNILTGEQFLLSMDSQITHVATVPDAGSTLALFGMAFAVIGGLHRRLTRI